MTKDRTKGRAEGRCSCCGKKLPKSKLGWGLIWHDGSGMCAKCLYFWRQAYGYFEDQKRKKELKEKREREKEQLISKT